MSAEVALRHAVRAASAAIFVLAPQPLLATAVQQSVAEPESASPADQPARLAEAIDLLPHPPPTPPSPTPTMPNQGEPPRGSVGARSLVIRRPGNPSHLSKLALEWQWSSA